MTVKERIKKFIKSQKMSDRAFCEVIGVSSSYISSMRVSIQPDKLTSIAEQFPMLNIDWLLTGEGEMLRKGDTGKEKIAGKVEPVADMVTMPREVFEMINRLTETLHSQQRTIESMEEQNKKTGAQPENNAGYAGVG